MSKALLIVVAFSCAAHLFAWLAYDAQLHPFQWAIGGVPGFIGASVHYWSRGQLIGAGSAEKIRLFGPAKSKKDD